MKIAAGGFPIRHLSLKPLCCFRLKSKHRDLPICYKNKRCGIVPLRKPEIMLSCIVTRLHRKRKKNFFFFSKYPMYSSEMLSNRIIHVSKKRRRTFPGAVSFKPLIQFYFSKELVFFCCTIIEIYQSLQVFVSFHSLSLVLSEQSCSLLRISSLQGIVTNFSVKECLIILFLRSLAVK